MIGRWRWLLLWPCLQLSALHAEPFTWTRDAALNQGLPPGLEIFRGQGDGLCAVLARAAIGPRTLDWNVAWSAGATMTPLEFAGTIGAPVWVTVNGGYFDARSSMSLIVEDGRIRAAGIAELLRKGERLPVARAALGKMQGALSEIRQVRPEGAPPTLSSEGRAWEPQTALGGGPLLVKEHARHVAAQAERFDAQSGVEPERRAPRTAVALTGDQHMLLLVVDGRSAHSRGVTLDELADMLLALGAREAMNLDGGGSSAMLVKDVVANHPSDAGGMRKVRSVLWLGDAPAGREPGMPSR